MDIKRLNNFYYESNVSILIGENGGGKSEILNKVSEDYLSKGYNIIAIANCIYDKFRAEGKKYNFIGARDGSAMIDNALINVFSWLNDKNVSIIGGVLGYCDYDSTLGIQLFFDKDFERNIKSFSIDEFFYRKVFKGRTSDFDRLLSALKSFIEYSMFNRNEIFYLNLNATDFVNFDYGNIFSEISKNLEYLKENKIIYHHEYYFFKNGVPIVYTKASSGELSKIVSLFFIASKIDDKTAILIDEPENSLHPRWQRDYIKKILDVFYMYSPKLIVATHSPIIISANVLKLEGVSIYHVAKFEITKIPNELLSGSGVESILWNVFETITPENIYLSRLLINMLSELESGGKDFKEFMLELNQLRNGCFDERQLSVLDGIESIARSKSF